jgi:hypothetical protein
MVQLRFGDANYVAGSAAAAVLCTVLTQRLFSTQAELLSETLAWLMLPFLLKAGQRYKADEIPRPSTHDKSASSFQGIWIFAAGIAFYSFCTAEIGAPGLYVSTGSASIRH